MGLSVSEQKGRVKTAFDLQASFWQAGYATVRSFRQYNFLIRRQYVLELLLVDARPGRYLDIGCASGDYLPALLERSYEVWGIDIAPAMVAKARERFGTSELLHLSVGDIEHLDSPDGFFDGVICAGVVEYLSEDRKALAEIWRVLKPGGVVVLTVPNGLSPFMMLDRIIHWFLRSAGALLSALGIFERILGRPRRNRSFTHRRYVPSRWNTQLARMGFRIADVSYSSFGSFALSRWVPWAVAFSRWYERFRRNPWLGVLGLTYTVKVVKP